MQIHNTALTSLDLSNTGLTSFPPQLVSCSVTFVQPAQSRVPDDQGLATALLGISPWKHVEHVSLVT